MCPQTLLAQDIQSMKFSTSKQDNINGRGNLMTKKLSLISVSNCDITLRQKEGKKLRYNIKSNNIISHVTNFPNTEVGLGDNKLILLQTN
jgi:hypothetical protein